MELNKFLKPTKLINSGAGFLVQVFEFQNRAFNMRCENADVPVTVEIYVVFLKSL